MILARMNVLPAVVQSRFFIGGRRRVPRNKVLHKNLGAFQPPEEVDFGKVRTSLIVQRQKPVEEKPLFPDDPDAPVKLEFNPYERAYRKCLLCELGVKVDYKNARLLQQFVSSFSGRVYDRHITALCNKQHRAVQRAIALSRRTGYMPVMTKDTKFLSDPKLFDPLRPVRPHSYDE